MEGITNLSFMNSPTFGHGAIGNLNTVMEVQGIKRPLIVTDPGLVNIGLIDMVRDNLSNQYGFELFAETPANPTQTAVEKAHQQYQENNCDGIIAFGGGSSIDLSKAVSVLVNNGGSIDEYHLGGKPIPTCAPIIAIPTTSGTGSEVSNGAVIVMNSGIKVVLVSPAMLPVAAICDPSATMGLPPVMTAGAGMDAVTHCIEAVLTPVINPPAEAVGLDGLRRAVREGNLEQAVRNGSDRDARYHMMLASTEGAMAFSKGLGAVHAMSHACGSLQDLGLHHGTLNGVFLPTILRFNEQDATCRQKYKVIAENMGVQANVLPETIEKLNRSIGLPANISEMGVTEDRFEYLADHCMQDLCHFTTPVPPSKEQYLDLFKQAS